jgi:hypothetical protein
VVYCLVKELLSHGNLETRATIQLRVFIAHC